MRDRDDKAQVARETFVRRFTVRMLAPALCRSWFFFRFQYRKSTKSPYIPG
jgi:hypothetical protein